MVPIPSVEAIKMTAKMVEAFMALLQWRGAQILSNRALVMEEHGPKRKEPRRRLGVQPGGPGLLSAGRSPTALFVQGRQRGLPRI